MAKPLTYLSLRCVLEYLEANKRIRLSTQCTALRKIEKTIPLHMDFFQPDGCFIIINSNKYRCKPCSDIEYGRVLENFYFFFFKGRCTIQVNRLKVDTFFRSVGLPIDLKLRVRELEVWPDIIPSLESIIDISRFPLKKLTILIWRPYHLTLPMVQTAESLWIEAIGIENLLGETLLKLSNPNIQLDSSFLSDVELMVFVQGLLDEAREIGTCYTFICWSWGDFLRLLEAKGKELQRKLKRKHKRNSRDTLFSITLPINLTLELCIRGECGYTCDSHVRMEVVPIANHKTSTNRFKAFFTSKFSRIANIFQSK